MTWRVIFQTFIRTRLRSEFVKINLKSQFHCHASKTALNKKPSWYLIAVIRYTNRETSRETTIPAELKTSIVSRDPLTRRRAVVERSFFFTDKQI